MAGRAAGFRGGAASPHYHFDQADVVAVARQRFPRAGCALAGLRSASSRRRRRRRRLDEPALRGGGPVLAHRRDGRPPAAHAAQRGARGSPRIWRARWACSAPAWTYCRTSGWRHWLGTCSATAAAALVVAGPRQPAEVHALAHLDQPGARRGGHGQLTRGRRALAAELALLAGAELAAGQVETLVILGGNPAFNAPADLDFAALLRKVPVTIQLGLEEDETSAVCSWHLPEAHFLESWGDARALDGTVSVQQPLIEPLYGGRTAAEVLALLTGYKDRRAYDIVRNYWLTHWPAQRARRPGARRCTTASSPARKLAEVKPTVDAARIAAALRGQPVRRRRAGSKSLSTRVASTWDGRFANNGWLQEAPDPMTKLTWDNAALVSPATARRLGLARPATWSCWPRDGREVTMPGDDPAGPRRRVRLRGAGLRPHALRARGTRRRPQRVPAAHQRLAVDRLRRRDSQDRPNHKLALTQDHHSMEGRPLVLEATLEEYRKDPKIIAKTDAARGALLALQGTHLRPGQPVGHGHRSERLRRLQRLRGGLPGREQHPHRGQGPGAARPRDALDPHGPLLRRARPRTRRR